MIGRVLRIGVALWAAAALAALPFGRAAWLGVLVGGGLGLANFWGLARIVSAIARPPRTTPGEDPPARGRRAALLGTALASKFVLLCALVWLVLRHADVSAIAFFAGVSVVVVAIFGAAAGFGASAGAAAIRAGGG